MSTVNLETPIASSVANGVTTSFPYSFTVLEAGDLVVQGTLAGVITLYTYLVHYTLTGLGTSSGSVEFLSAPANGTTITRYRDTEISREADYQVNGDLPAETLNDDINRLYYLLQEIFNGGKGPPSAIRAPNGTALSALPGAPADFDGYYIGFAGGQPTYLLAPAGTAGALASDLATSSVAAKGVGQIGYSPAVAYLGGLGQLLNYTYARAAGEVLAGITPANYGYPVGNLKRYGCVLDGATDDTTGFANAALCAKVGDTLFHPGGTLKLTAVVRFKAGVTLKGRSSVATAFGVHTYAKSPSRIYQASAATHCIEVVGDATVDTACDINVFDIAFSAVATPAVNDAPQANKYAIQMRGTPPYSAYRISIERCLFHGFDFCVNVEGYDTGAGVDWQADNVKIERCTFYQFNVGIRSNTLNADAWDIANNVFAPAPSGIAIQFIRSGYTILRNNYCVPGLTTGSLPATLTEFVRWGAYPDNCKMIGNAGSDSLAYFLHVDASTGFENVFNIIDLDGNVIEAPILVERQCKIMSRANRFTFDATCTGNDVEVHSDGDSWFPTTKKWVMSGLRPRLFVSPGSTQTSGSVVTVSTVAATAFTLPASAGVYVMGVWQTNGGSTYKAIATLICDGTNLDVVHTTGGAGMVISRSGRNVQVTQNSGAGMTVQWSYNRLS